MGFVNGSNGVAKSSIRQSSGRGAVASARALYGIKVKAALQGTGGLVQYQVQRSPQDQGGILSPSGRGGG